MPGASPPLVSTAMRRIRARLPWTRRSGDSGPRLLLAEEQRAAGCDAALRGRERDLATLAVRSGRRAAQHHARPEREVGRAERIRAVLGADAHLDERATRMRDDELGDRSGATGPSILEDVLRAGRVGDPARPRRGVR